MTGGYHQRTKKRTAFFEAVISISVAVISMSLDDAIAISSIISIDGNMLDLKRMVAALAGLFFGAFILLLFSDTMTELIEEFSILNNLCAGYLTYMAIRMIFEDDTIKLFFERVNFTFTIPGAVLCGILMAFYSLFANGILPGCCLLFPKLSFGSYFRARCKSLFCTHDYAHFNFVYYIIYLY